MSSLQSKQLIITYSNCQTYLSAQSGMTIHSTSWGNTVIMKSSRTSYAYANLNNSAKAILFPNNTAHPVKADVSTMVTRTGISGTVTASVCFEIDGVSLGSKSNSQLSEAALSIVGSTISAVTNCTKSSTLRYGVKTSNSSYEACAGVEMTGVTTKTYVTLYFNQYDFAATAGTGIATATVSSETGYDGDTITYSCTLQSGATFDGWYNGSTRVSTSQSYTHTVNGADVTLQARATGSSSSNTLSATYNGSSLFSVSTSGNVTVSYNGSTIATLTSGTSKTLKCNGKVMLSNVVIGGKTLQCNGKLMASDVVINYE